MIRFKKLIFWTSLLFSLIILVIDYLGTYKVCGDNGYGTCVDNLANIIILSLIIFPVFLVSAITYFLKDRVFLAWLKFSSIWIPLQVILSLLTPRYGGAGIISIDRGAVSFVLSALYLIISLVLIAYKSWKLRGT